MNRLPEFGDVFEAALGARLGDLRAIDVGEVVSWSKAYQVAQIRPLVSPGGDQRATIPGCVVVFPGAYWDLQAGDTGLLLVADRDYHRWWRTGEASVPATAARHGQQNSLFLPGLRHRSDPREIPSDSMVLEKAATGGYVFIGDPSSSKFVVHEDLLSDLDDLLTAWDTFNGLLDTWAAAVGVATGVAWAGQPVQAALVTLGTKIAALTNGIAADDYESSVVKVEE